MSDISFSKPIELWTFEPENDLTPQELVDLAIALAPALNMQLNNSDTYDAFPESVKRHFQKRPIAAAALKETGDE